MTEKVQLNLVKNSRGTVWYGMHFVPGIAEYTANEEDPEPNAIPKKFRIYINDTTIREMGPTFTGCPVFVDHVDEVDGTVDEVSKDAHGWVVESFFNDADGKHWVKFITTSEKAEKAIRKGYRLSNCYQAKSHAKGGHWNGVQYTKEVTGGEYEHLAIVQNPRYEESVILTPEQFKAYNEEKRHELLRVANAKDGENKTMSKKTVLNFFKRKVEKMENSVDLEEMSVTLPKSGKEVTIIQLVNEADEALEAAKKPKVANGDDMVDMDGAQMTVNALMEKCKNMAAELAAMKEPKENGEEHVDPNADPMTSGETPSDLTNEEDGEEKEEKEEKVPEKKEEKKEDKTKNATDVKAKADRLKNAPKHAQEQVARVEFSDDQVARGRKRYGSN